MFVLLNIRDTGLDAEPFARGLLDSERVAVLPCDGFGASAEGHLRISLGAPDAADRGGRAAHRPLRPAPGAAPTMLGSRTTIHVSFPR